ncbi:hypothetical protein [Paenibacillus agricola]|uniref:Uncharacterized protein n=1 Tax=Paenibacillus agricola TaxID=2716264 RepID=A0ABX0J776_9BACL|nr:hypothetical protein [Paenibacillus agricola]NHN29640.1 hypothetical protein [Paenibacillus agricola]
MENLFPSLKITIKGEGKEKDNDKDFFKECKEKNTELIDGFSSSYLEEKEWIENQFQEFKHGCNHSIHNELSRFYKDRFENAYIYASGIVPGYPRKEDITDYIISSDLEQIENTMNNIIQKKIEGIASGFRTLSDLKIVYEDDKELQYNDISQLSAKILSYSTDILQKVKQNYKNRNFDLIWFIVERNIQFYNYTYDGMEDSGGW